MAEFALSIMDYVIVVSTLLVSAFIGTFFALCGGRQQTSEEYFLGNRRMNVIPLAISMTVTSASITQYLSLPGEVYVLGPQYAFMFLNKIIAALLTTIFFLPVFYRLRLVSVYQYYDDRFGIIVRYIIVVTEVVYALVSMGSVIFAASLAVSTIMDVNLTITIIIVGTVSAFYTTIGGFKAVVWADVFQATIMLIGLLLMIIIGTIEVGGASEGWRRAGEGQRTRLVDFNPDPTLIYSFWTIMIGGTLIASMVNGTKQPMIQRYNACKTESEAKLVAWLGMIGIGVFQLLPVVCGLVIYAYYAYCDPLTTGRIKSPDQLVALFMTDIFQNTPGLPGIVIAGAFSAALSSISSIINSLAAIIGETIIRGYLTGVSEKTYTCLIKLLSAFIGLISICMALITSYLGGLIQLGLTLGGILGAPGLGVVILGIFVPRADSRSAVCGMLTALAICLTIEVGARVTGSRTAMGLPLSTEGCGDGMYNETSPGFTTTTSGSNEVNTTPDNPVPDVSSHIPIFAISPLHYSTISTLLTVTIGVLVSYLPGNKGPESCDPDHLTPMVQRYYLKKYSRSGDGVQLTGIRKISKVVGFENDLVESECRIRHD